MYDREKLLNVLLKIVKVDSTSVPFVFLLNFVSVEDVRFRVRRVLSARDHQEAGLFDFLHYSFFSWKEPLKSTFLLVSPAPGLALYSIFAMR